MLRGFGCWRIPPFAFLSCIPLWVGARGIEFDWKYIQMSIDSNISLVRSPALPHALLLVAVVFPKASS